MAMTTDILSRKRTHNGRRRVNSHSSLEIEVAQSPSSVADTVDNLLLPNAALLEVLKAVGAKGSWTPCGLRELFSLRQIQSHVLTYAYKNQLVDPINPLVIYCKDDILGTAFGVDKFLQREALVLIQKSCQELSHNATKTFHTSTLSSSDNDKFAVPQLENIPQKLNPFAESISKNASISNYHPELKKARRASPNSESAHQPPCTDQRRGRTRHSSLSIVYSDTDTRSNTSALDYDWRLTFTSLCVNESDTESIYSIQSRETAPAKDSSDDMWFDDETNNPSDLDTISVQMNNEGISLEFNTGEEYEVITDEQATYAEYDSDGSESPIEEIYVVLESDEDVWADSESSDTECENMSADEEISEGDKWTCTTCGELNYPLRRHCDRCWALRNAWLPPKQKKFTKSQQRIPNIENQADCAQDNLTSSLSENIKEITPFTQSTPTDSDVVCSVDLKATSRSSISSPSTPNVPKLESNDSGLGSSLTFSQSYDLDSGISSQERSTVQQDNNKFTCDAWPETIACNFSGSSVEKEKLLYEESRNSIAKPIIHNEFVAQTVSSNAVSAIGDCCVICLTKPKEASIIHGKTGHQVCCYVCAKRLKRKGKSCPVCRRSITKVIKNYLI